MALVAGAAKIPPPLPTYPAPVLTPDQARATLADAISRFMARYRPARCPRFWPPSIQSAECLKGTVPDHCPVHRARRSVQHRKTGRERTRPVPPDSRPSSANSQTGPSLRGHKAARTDPAFLRGWNCHRNCARSQKNHFPHDMTKGTTTRWPFFKELPGPTSTTRPMNS